MDLNNAKKDKDTEQSRAAVEAEKIKNNPLLKYMREKALRKMQEKKIRSRDR